MFLLLLCLAVTRHLDEREKKCNDTLLSKTPLKTTTSGVIRSRVYIIRQCRPWRSVSLLDSSCKPTTRMPGVWCNPSWFLTWRKCAERMVFPPGEDHLGH